MNANDPTLDPTPAVMSLIWSRYRDLAKLAALVHQLRAAQKAGGKGYKTPADAGKAQPLEQQVDDLLRRIVAGPIVPIPGP